MVQRFVLYFLLITVWFYDVKTVAKSTDEWEASNKLVAFSRHLNILPEILREKPQIEVPRHFMTKFAMGISSEYTVHYASGEPYQPTPLPVPNLNSEQSIATAQMQADAQAQNPSGRSRMRELSHTLFDETDAEKNFWYHYKVEGLDFCRNVCVDYTKYYTLKNGLHLLIAVGIAAPFANTSLDMDFHNWYQDNVRSSGSDSFASVCKVFGEGKYVLPFFGGMTLIALATDKNLGWLDLGWGEYTKNTSRAFLVGGPPVLIMQCLLGGDRPCNGSTNWTPFQHNHGVSGHAFVGATPFIMAAKMSDSIWLKILFYTCSTLPAWSRINDGAHSLSQVGLGWYMAYMACEAVTATNQTHVANYAFTPIFTGDEIGINFMMRF